MGFERRWHGSYATGVPPAIEPERVTMAEALRRTAERFPNRTALVYLGRKISFRELEALVNRFARALAALGVQAGDRVATLLPNIPQQLIVNHACYRLGAVVALSDPLCSEQELEEQLRDSGANILVTLDMLLVRVAGVRAKTAIKTIIPCHINDYLPFPTRQLIPLLHKGLHLKLVPGPGIRPFLDTINRESGEPVPLRAGWEEPAAILYAGGTTGISRGAVLTHANLSVAVQQLRAWLGGLGDGAESLLGLYPVFHFAGCTLSQNLPVWAGWTCVLVPRPERTVILDMLKKYRPGLFPCTPGLFDELLRQDAFRKLDWSFLRGVFSSVDPLPEETATRIEKLTGRRVHDLYGLSEATAFAAATPWNGEARPGTVGVPLPNTDLRIVDWEAGLRELPAGESGEICVRGPQLMTGYHEMPEEMAAATGDGWLRTGDSGFLDERGYLTVTGRRDDWIVVGGTGVRAGEIDAVLAGHPRILEACAIGVPDDGTGLAVRAFVVVRPGDPLTREELLAYCAERLAAPKAPTQVVFVAALPRNSVGRILKRELLATGGKPQAD